MTAALPLFDYDASQRMRNTGMKQVVEHAPEYFALAYAALERVARRQRVLFADDLTAELRSVSRERPHPNIMGPIFQHAVRNQLIQRTTEVRASADPRKRGRLCPVYFSLVHRSI
jgi:hypothetical protein